MDTVLKNWIFVVTALAVCSIFFAIGVKASADTYLGCYDESGNVERFVHNTGIALSNLTTSNLATDGCREHCRKTLIYSFAGLWGGTHCHCAEEVVNKDGIAKVNDSLCHLSCPEEPTEFCGGSKTSSIFSVYSVCSRGLYGRNCTSKCNCKDNKSCTVLGVCQNECTAGWLLNSTIPNKAKCSIDIDECKTECNSTNSINCHNCSLAEHQKCKNTKGSFQCICRNGYNETNYGTCEDIDECAARTHNCTQHCSNTDGSFTCSCWAGYELERRFSCKDINECQRRTSGCQQRCENTDGNYTCGCNDGFRQSITNRLNCDDIDECAEGNSSCMHNCTNTIGRYNCSCRTGYELLSNGYTCNDTNECLKNTSECQQRCFNTDGSYTCGCNIGFRQNTTNRLKCDDIDECAEGSSNCTHNCTNTIGGYNCSCRAGYELHSNGYTCNDVDECERNTSSCEQKCNNTDGSYICDCNYGFRINTTNTSRCVDIDECTEGSSGCGQICNNTVGNYSCSCKPGYELYNDHHKCNDIDECSRDNGKCNQNCTNNPGSYECECNIGFKLGFDNHTCEDIDECDLKTSKCNQNCTNTYGWYNCSCETSGYRLEGEFNCTDVDECADNNGGCQHYCSNTVGSFGCSCKPGYRISVKIGETYNCTDINECEENSSDCAHNCNNTIGGYNCSCFSGFLLHSDLKNCNDVDECKDKIDSCSQKCDNGFGNYSCSCHDGYDLVGKYTCNKNHTGTILGVTIALLLVWIILIVIILLKVKKIYPFDQSRLINNFWKRAQDTVPNENGTKEHSMELKKTPAKAVTTKAAVKKSRKTAIVVKDLKKYIEKIQSSGGFEEEFKSIPMVSELSYEFAQSPSLKSKNRFKNILPYDNNRVVLDELNNDPLTTYINASFIKGYSTQDKIIASHGPTPSTQNDFWRLIWQYEVTVIVMVTKCMEDAKRKCEQYWPLEGSMESGDLTISMMSTDKWPDYIITRLKVTKESTSRQLVHLLFTAWPDHGAPDHATSLLSFRRAARNVIVADKYFLVHCSAGVGRTGTFLAIDFLLQEAKDKGSINVYAYLEGLRDQRMHAVQTLDQYEFIHLALLEALTLGETVTSCTALSEHRKHLDCLNPLTGKTYIQTEFEMLQEMHPSLSAEATSAALDKENISRNRNPGLVPGDVNRVLLRDPESENNYINAVYVSSYRMKDAFISTELPLNETLTDFWSMVLDYKCKLVAFLDTSGALDDLNNHLLVPVKTRLVVAKQKVWTHSFEPKKLSDSCSSYFIAVANPPDDDEDIYANAEDIPSFKVLVLHFNLSRRLAQLLPEVNEQIKTSSHNIKDDGPVVIVSRDGVNPSGQYIAVSNLLEMATSQHEVDVFNAVHNIKKTQPYFITSLDEYQMIFDALEAEGDTSTYANI